MIPVYQTIFDNKKGNCWAATTASLLEIPLDIVPNFVEYDNDFEMLQNFMRGHGYEFEQYIINGHRKLEKSVKDMYAFFDKQLPEIGGINGFYSAIVYSPGYFDLDKYQNGEAPTTHSVIIDKTFNIVHDPNPKYAGIKYPMSDVYGSNGVIGVELWRKIK